MVNECKGIFGRLFGHDFQATFTKGGPTMTNVTGQYTANEMAHVVESSKSIMYHGHVCTRCGAIVNRQVP